MIFLLMLKPIGHPSDDFDVIGRDPALTAVGELDVVPVTHSVKNPYRGAFMEDEERSPGIRIQNIAYGLGPCLQH